MSCAVAYRHKSDFAVFAIDGRVTDEHGVICTDRAVKFVQLPCGMTWAFAGDLGAIQDMITRLRATGPEQLVDVRKAVDARPVREDEQQWSALVYDVRKHLLYTADSDGSVLTEYERCAAVGGGSDVALGYLAGRGGARAKWTVAQARVETRQAIKQAAKRCTTVSSKSTVLTIDALTGRTNMRG